MKKLVWLLVIALLVVPAFAASAEFKFGLWPLPGYLQAGNFTLVWSGKYSDQVDAWAGMGFGVWSGRTDWGNPGTWFAGGIVLKNLGGKADLRLAWNEDVTDSWMGGTMLVGKPLEGYNTSYDKFSGAILTLKTPLKVALAVRSLLSSSPQLVDRVAVRVDGTFAPVTVYGLGYVDAVWNTTDSKYTFTNPVATVGTKVDIPGLPVPASVRGEVRVLPSVKWVLRGDVTPVSGVSLQARYYDDNSWRLYGTLSNIPNTTVSGSYYSSGYYYVYVSTTQTLPVGKLTLWGGVQQSAPTVGVYAKLETPLPGGVTNTLKVFYNYDDDAEVSWFSSNGFSITNSISVSW